MSKRHESSRRRSYGRRQHELHELHERTDRLDAGNDWLGESGSLQGTRLWDAAAASGAPRWPEPRGIE
jgi:hypothetical protein